MANPPSRKPSWRDAADSSRGGVTGNKPWQQGRDKSRLGAPWWQKRPFRIAMVGGSIALLLGLILAVVLYFRPPKPFAVVLMGAGYQENLALPHNVPGVRGVEAIGAWADSIEQGSTRSVPLTHDAFKSDQPFKDLSVPWYDKAARTVIVIVAAHGVVRPDKDATLQPYLVADDANLANDDSYYPLDRILDALGKLPEKTNKLLVLDCTTVESWWPLGLLHNDVGRLVKEQQEKVARVPNLVVLCSSDAGQRSWPAPEHGETAFLHALLEAFQGAKDATKGWKSNQRIEADEVYAHVAESVQRWARDNRARLQRPFLLGAERARGMKLMATPEKPPAQGPSDNERKASAAKALGRVLPEWKKAEELQGGQPHPAIYSPQLWRRYLDTVLRAEQLARWADVSGKDDDHVGHLLEQADKLRKTIERERTMPLGSFQLTATMPQALGMRLTSTEMVAVEKFMKAWLADAPKTEVSEARAQLLKAAGPDLTHQYLVGAAAAAAVLREVAAAPQKRWTAGQAQLEALEQEVHYTVRPAEVHYSTMLHSDKVDTSPLRPLLGANEWTKVGRALTVRLLAEEAALGLGPSKDVRDVPGCSEQVRPWIASLIRDADARRRHGEDLLFSSAKKDWDVAEGELQKAATQYEEAESVAADIRQAVWQRDRALAMLPYFSRWLADRGPEVKDDEVVELWGKVHQVRIDLESAPGEFKGWDLLRKNTRAIRDGLASLEKEATEVTTKDYAKAANQDAWREIEAVLTLPFVKSDDREKLIKDSDAIAADLRKVSQGKEISPEETLRRARAAAQRQGRLALAMLGNQSNPQGFSAAQNALDAGSEVDWFGALNRSGDYLGKEINSLPELANQAAEAAAHEPLPAAAIKLSTAARQTRQIGGGVGEDRLPHDPIGEQRRLLLHDLLCWQAQRTYLDFWADRKQGEPYYFQTAARKYLTDASDLVTPKEGKLLKEERANRLATVLERSKELDNAKAVTIEWAAGEVPDLFKETPASFAYTDQKSVEWRYRLVCADAKAFAGTPVWWRQVTPGGIDLIRDQEGPPRPEPGGEQKPADFGKEVLRSRIAAKDDADGTAEHILHGYFRGHHPTAVTQVVVQGEPNHVWSAAPKRRGARLAVQTQGGLYDQIGPKNAAIAIVLDLSGSMREKANKDEPDTKEVQAKKALDTVLRFLPPGVTVSVRVFGAQEFTKPGDMKDKGGIRRIFGPKAWEGDDDRKALKVDLESLHAYYETPLVRSIGLAVEEDLKPLPARTVLVITDGGDSNWYAGKDEDLKDTGAKKLTDYVTEKFKDRRTQLVVIGYGLDPLTDADAKAAVELRDSAIPAVGGKYYAAPTSSQLVGLLKQTLLHMYFEVDADEDLRDLPVGGKDITTPPDHPRWVALPDEGHYRVRIPSLRESMHRCNVHREEALLLNLTADAAGQPRFQRALYAQSEFLRKNHFKVETGEAANWLLGVEGNEKPATENVVRLMTTLEKKPRTGRGGDPLRQIYPGWVWFEVPPVPDAPPPRLRRVFLPDYPAPAWSIDVRRGEIKKAPAAPVHAWWTESLDDCWELKKHGNDWKRKDPMDWPKEVEVESITVERPTKKVVVKPGDPGEDPGMEYRDTCLVVRLRFPPNTEPFFVRVPGEDQAAERGEEHRFYTRAGKYTGIFWNVNDTGFDRVDSLQVYSVKTLKEKAEKEGTVLKMDLPEPDERWRRPAAP
jgi:hypothetical protein